MVAPITIRKCFWGDCILDRLPIKLASSFRDVWLLAIASDALCGVIQVLPHLLNTNWANQFTYNKHQILSNIHTGAFTSFPH